VTANSRQPEDRPWSDLSTVLDLITVAIDPRKWDSDRKSR
jgi:hypothetical protein